MAIAVLVVFCALPAVAQAAAFGSRSLSKGDSGADVRTLQELLTQAGHATTVDGMFGSGTKRSVQAWETDAERKVNGRVSRPDARALRTAVQTTAAHKGESAEPANTGGSGYVEVTEAYIGSDGLAVAPANAPKAVKQIIAAGNRIHSKPYRYGGGHGKWKDSGYDCSGSVSYALHGAKLLKQALDSTGFMSWGSKGVGTWVTIYAHGGHAYMVVAGLRFDTSGAKESGSRWSEEMRSPAGFTAVHPPGL